MPKALLFLGWLLVLLLGACSPTPDMETLMEEGEPLYISTCGHCHQNDGSGFEDFPRLAGNPVVTLHEPAPLIDIVHNGRGSMPAFRGSLDENQLAAVLTYIRNSWGNEASLVTPKQVR